VVLQTGKLHGGPRAILDRLLDGTDGYRQRCLEVKHEESTNRWWLYVTYDFPASPEQELSQERIVGADLGFACPLYAAVNNGHARLGWRHFAGLAARIRSLQTQVMARRRNMLIGGKSSLSADTARSGHGRKRKLRSIEQLEGRIGHAYSTLNHQLSSTLIEFAKNNGAGVIQMEDLSGLQEELTGTFLGARWRYHQLQEYVKYKAEEVGIKLRKVNPRFTSRRCSECGHIVVSFDRKFRDANKTAGYTTKFKCPNCEYEADPDYNAARNLATLDIEGVIRRQCQNQGVDYPDPKTAP
jgi:IS605 OrfB family transposase